MEWILQDGTLIQDSRNITIIQVRLVHVPFHLMPNGNSVNTMNCHICTDSVLATASLLPTDIWINSQKRKLRYWLGKLTRE